MKKSALTPLEIRRLQARCRVLVSKLGDFDTLSQGSVMFAPPGAWRWTRKVRGKTVSLGLSAEKAQKMKQAITNHRALDKVIAEIREITQKLILEAPETTPKTLSARSPKSPLT